MRETCYIHGQGMSYAALKDDGTPDDVFELPDALNWQAEYWNSKAGTDIDMESVTIPSIFMPRWASRLTLIVTDVRVQRLQEISEDDAKAEGCPGWYSPAHPDQGVTDGRLPHEEFAELWDSLNAGRGYPWNSNPWICALTFDVIKQNIDHIKKEAA